ncbi:LAGLIDADG family homing endonuclease [Priestia megaterium]
MQNAFMKLLHKHFSEDMDQSELLLKVFEEGYKAGATVSAIDGEGCLDLHRITRPNKKKGTKDYVYSRSIIANKNFEFLEYIRDYLQLGKIRYVSSQDIYRLELNNKETQQLVKDYGSLFIVKQNEARLLERYYKNQGAGLHLKREMKKLKRGLDDEKVQSAV